LFEATLRLSCSVVLAHRDSILTPFLFLYTSIVKVDLYNMKCLRFTRKIALVTRREAPLVTSITTLNKARTMLSHSTFATTMVRVERKVC
jgi:hypothetical protein